MDEDKKKTIMIIIIVSCLTLAIAVTYFTNQGGGGRGDNKIWLKCNNPDCGDEYQLTRKELAASMSDDGAPGMPGMMGMMGMGINVFVCPKCEEESAYMATKCSNKECGVVFIMNPSTTDYPDRCPECGISAMEVKRERKE